MILAIKTDEKLVYIGIWNAKQQELCSKSWEAGRELSDQLLTVISELFVEVNAALSDMTAVIVFEGPGSYTGLRIGISTANALGYSYSIPVVGITGSEWVRDGFKKLDSTNIFAPATPKYGGSVHTTKPKK